MLCSRCMTVMRSGTSYGKDENGAKPFAKRFHECKKCHERIYTKEPNFQEYLKETIGKAKEK